MTFPGGFHAAAGSPNDTTTTGTARIDPTYDTALRHDDSHDETWFHEQLKYADEFTVTDEHLALARRVNMGWALTEWAAAPGFALKRPYGNSNVHRNIAAIVDGVFLNPIGGPVR